MTQFKDFDASVLQNYLAMHDGWRLTIEDERATVWAHAGGTKVFTPTVQAPDTDELVLHAARKIALVETRNESDVLFDLVYSGRDRLDTRREVDAKGMRMRAGVALHDSIFQGIAAARHSIEKTAHSYVGGPPKAVTQYLDDVVLLPSIPGSFVVRALLPVSPTQLTLAFTEVDRAASPGVRLMDASTVAVEAAEEVAASGTMETWNDTVPDGVSAQLCEALATMAEPTGIEGESTDLSMTWSWAHPDSSIGKLAIPARLSPFLGAGADFLRSHSIGDSLLMIGRIVKLHREEKFGPGEVTVRGTIEGSDNKERALIVPLSEPDYRTAGDAHHAGVTVRVAAVVERKTNRLEVTRTESFGLV